MNKFWFTCKYCNHTWYDHYYSYPTKGTVRCPDCKDKNVRIREDKNIDYYITEFPKKDNEGEIE